MNDNEVKTVQMTVEEAAQYAAFKAEQERKAAADKARKDREVYGQMVDEEIEQAIPMLRELSGDIRTVKEQVLDNFRQILDMKADVLKRTKDGQKSHTFTNSTGDKRITIGRCVVDGWRDTVEDGIAIVKEAVMGLIKDDETKAMINQIMRLIARDQNGNLKASKVLQLDTLAEELHNERLNEGIAIIKGAQGATSTATISTFTAGFVLVLITLFVVLNLKDSRAGRAIMALRDNSIAAESVGLNLTKYKLMAFVTSAALAGAAGALYGLNFSSLQASKFDFNTSILILVFVVLGVLGNIWGSLIAAAALTILPEALRQFSDYRMLVYAIVLILVMLLTNNPTLRSVLSRLRPGASKEKEAA